MKLLDQVSTLAILFNDSLSTIVTNKDNLAFWEHIHCICSNLPCQWGKSIAPILCPTYDPLYQTTTADNKEKLLKLMALEASSHNTNTPFMVHSSLNQFADVLH
jgi:hypothetical protein